MSNIQMSKPTLGIYGPMRPDKSGVALYIARSLPVLESYFECRHVSNRNFIDPSAFDLALYHLGNNNYHDCAFSALRLRPGVVVLHEYKNLDYYYSSWNLLPTEEQERLLNLFSSVLGVQLHSRSDLEEYLSMHPEIDRYSLNTGCERIAIEQASRVLVHSQSVVSQLRDLYPETDINTLPFPVSPIAPSAGDLARHLSNLSDDFTFGVFGYLGEYKRIERIVEAWMTWTSRPVKAILLFVGEQQYDVDIPSCTSIRQTGYVSDEEFDALILAIDCGIQLRYPSLGETSGVISSLVAHMRPVILSCIPEMADYAQYPNIQFVSVGEQEVEELQLAMGNAYQARSPQVGFRDEYSWGRWGDQVQHYLTSEPGHPYSISACMRS